MIDGHCQALKHLVEQITMLPDCHYNTARAPGDAKCRHHWRHLDSPNASTDDAGDGAWQNEKTSCPVRIAHCYAQS